MLRFAFRVDASLQIGSGHVMRCLTLADALRERGGICHFYCLPQPGDRIAQILSRGYPVTQVGLSQDLPCDFQVDWLITDHYQLDAAWEARQTAVHRMVIDDLADRSHYCDLLLDQNLRTDAASRYRSLVPLHCRLFLGPSHALLRPDFAVKPQRVRNGNVRHVFVYFGGNDCDNQVGLALKALESFPKLSATVVLGSDHPHREALLAEERTSGVVVTEICSDMAAAMVCADIALGACGITAWERCALGLPTLVCVTADNQREDADNLHRLGAVENLGESAEVGEVHWVDALHRALLEPARIVKMSQAAARVVDGFQENQISLLNILQHG